MFQREFNQKWRMLSRKTKISNYSKDRVVGESCTIFNQRSYSYFQSLSLFYCRTNSKLDSNSIKVHALLDSGAFICFADCHKLPLNTKKHLIFVEIIDGRPLVSRDVIHETIPLDIVLEMTP
jgi:hypothetical protein